MGIVGYIHQTETIGNDTTVRMLSRKHIFVPQFHPIRFSKTTFFPQNASTSLAAVSVSFFPNTSPTNPPGTGRGIRHFCFFFRCRFVAGVEVDSARSEPVAGHGRMCGAATTRKDNTAVVVKRLAVENDFGCIAGGILEV